MMKRIAFFISLCVFFTISISALAQSNNNVTVRTKVLDGYARLVFSGADVAKYTVDRKNKQSVTITFNKAQALDQSKADFSKIQYIGDVKLVSSNPVILQINVPKSSKTRHFKIGKRIILDVYKPNNPQDTALKTTSAKKEKKSPVKASDNKAVNKITAPKKAATKSTVTAGVVPKIKKEVVTKAKALPAVPPAYVLLPEKLEPKEEHAPKAPEKSDVEEREERAKQAIKKAVNQKEHIVSLRATQPLGVAVYENYGELRLVVTGGNSFTNPVFSSPQPDLFSAIRTVQSGELSVYSMTLPDDHFYIKGVGGALAWDIVLGDKVNEGEAVKPQRIVEEVDGVRGGKIIWPFEGNVKIIEVAEPQTGKTLFAVVVDNASQFAGAAQNFVDFDVIRSPVGLVVRPKVDDLSVQLVKQGVEISRPSGLAIALPQDIEAVNLFKKDSGHKVTASTNSQSKEEDDGANVFLKFKAWKASGKISLGRYENIILSGIHGQSDARRVEDIMKLGKLYLAHGRGAEALGYLNFAEMELPELNGSAEYRALRGVAKALAWKSEQALEDLFFTELDNIDEINMWKSFVLADLGDWQQAISLLPASYEPLYTYPDDIARKLAIGLIEINLRAGQVTQAEELMNYIQKDGLKSLPSPLRAALKYLRGEANRQLGEIKQTKSQWKSLVKGDDDLYRAKAGLALAILQSNKEEISNDEKIDRLERLRYTWRGDGLEAQINYWLGDAYFESERFVKGLTIMRDAAIMAKGTVLASRITADMAETFTEMYMGPALDNVSALDAVTVFEQFQELTPLGEKGDLLVQRLAEHLVRSDLLGRATKLLGHQVDHRLQGANKIRIAIRLAAIELLDQNPQKAINALRKASDELKRISDPDELAARKRDIELLRIRAYAQNQQYDRALELIESLADDPRLSRLKANVAWKAQYWDIAADALNDVILQEDISLSEPMTAEQTEIILNRAIALNLDGDRIELANMREKYSALLLETNKDKARQFEVITRPRRSGILQNTDALLSAVSEVDLFKEFLESYKSN